MSLEKVTAAMSDKVAAKGAIAGKIVTFDFGADGRVRIDGASVPPVVSNEEGPADCTVTVSLHDFIEMGEGRLNPQMAFMMGKLKIGGDMGIALQLGSILG